jgi:hypothetical protein
VRAQAREVRVGDVERAARAQHADVGLGDREFPGGARHPRLRGGAAGAGACGADRALDPARGPHRDRQVRGGAREPVVPPDLRRLERTARCLDVEDRRVGELRVAAADVAGRPTLALRGRALRAGRREIVAGGGDGAVGVHRHAPSVGERLGAAAVRQRERHRQQRAGHAMRPARGAPGMRRDHRPGHQRPSPFKDTIPSAFST